MNGILRVSRPLNLNDIYLSNPSTRRMTHIKRTEKNLKRKVNKIWVIHGTTAKLQFEWKLRNFVQIIYNSNNGVATIIAQSLCLE